MTIHPRSINRRRRDLRYVLVHRSSSFTSRSSGIVFKNGVSAPLTPSQAAGVAASMGGKIRYGYCTTVPQVFGDATPEERAAALRCAGVEPTQEERLRSLWDRFGEAHTRIGDEPPTQEAFDHALEEFRSMESDERDQALKEGEEALAEMLSAIDALEAEAREQGGENGQESEPPAFTDEQPPAPSSGDPLRMPRAALEEMTKGQLEEWAMTTLGLVLSQSQTKAQMLDALYADPRIVDES